MIKAKFKCISTSTDLGDTTVQLEPVMDGSEENKSFARYTPNGKLEMDISEGTPAADFFEEGKEYYLTFNPA